jgi:hypothetical protein
MTKSFPDILVSSIISLILFFISSATSSAFEPPACFQQDTVKVQRKQPVYTTSRLTTPKPVIDGKLDDECWKKGVWAGNYTQFIPDEGAKPTYPTELNIQYDDRNLYVAFRAYDYEPDKIKRLAGVKDEFVGDMMGITFDSYRDYRTGFEFTITAWGQKIDLILFNPDNWDVNWEAVWKGKVGLEDSAWVAELEIPFSQLRYSNQDEQVWGMHTWRWIDRLQQESNWEKQSKTGPGMLYNFGELRGIKGLKKSHRLEIMPYTLGKLNTMEEVPGNPFTENGRSWGGNVGLDAKIGISSNFTLDITMNPDFGQVESDPSVMNLTAFETFYEEKRPFFLEGLTIFNFESDNQSLFYSRRIGHPPSLNIASTSDLFVKMPDKTKILSAIKFSGTTSKGLSLGLIQSITANEYARQVDLLGNRTSQKVEPLTNYMIARIQKGYNAGTTVVGAMLTSTNRFINNRSLDFLSNNAYTGGVDLIHRWKDKKYYVNAILTGSYISGSALSIRKLQESSARYYQRPDADYVKYDTTASSLSGFGGIIGIGKGTGLWRYSTGIRWSTPGLELNDLGYMNYADEINQENVLTYFVNQPVSIFRTYQITLEQFNTWNFGGVYLGSGGHLSFTSEFKNQWSFNANLIYHSAGTDTRILRGGYDMKMPYVIHTFGGIKTDPSHKIIVGSDFGYDYGGNNSASSWQIRPSLSVRPISMLKFVVTADYEETRNELQYVTTVNYSPSARYVLGTIDQVTLGLTFRAALYLTPELSIQYYGSPFVSRGKYTKLKRVDDPMAQKYTDRFTIYDNIDLVDGVYEIDENNDLITDYSFNNPDFNFHQFRSNMVAKWEYRPGSYIYLVWSSERTGFTRDPSSNLGESFKQLGKVFPNNVFLVKVSYWFSL